MGIHLIIVLAIAAVAILGAGLNATRTAVASGLMSATATWNAAAPVAGDTINIGAFTIYCDYSLALASVVTNGGKLVPTNGNIELDITAATLTGHLKIDGSPGQLEYKNSTDGYAVKGVGGI